MEIEKIKNSGCNITKSNQDITEWLKKIFWDNILKWIWEYINSTNLEWIKKMNLLVWQKFISSCFHPNEYWIWAYRTTSLVNITQLADELWMKEVIVDYLDTISKWWIKWVLNPQLNKDFQKKTLFTTIEEKWNKSNIREKIKDSNDIFESFLDTSFKNNTNGKTISYIKDILKEINIDIVIEDFIKNIANNEIDNIKNKWWDIKNTDLYIKKKQEQFISFLIWNKIKDRLIEIKGIFSKNTLGNKKYSKWISEAEIYRELQNAIFTILIKENFWEHKILLEKYWITKDWNFNQQISYNNSETINNQQELIKKILEDHNLWEGVLLKYFDNLIKRTNWRDVEILTFWKNRINSLIISNKDWKNNFYIKEWKDRPYKISNEEWFNILSWKEKKLNYNISWNIMLFLSAVSWQFHIWSERWYREIVAETFEWFLKEKWNLTKENKNYIDRIILWLWIFDTFDENWENKWKKIAWSVWTTINDMIKLLFIWWNFSKDQIKKSIDNNLEIPEINNDKLFDSLLNEIRKIEWKIISLDDSDNNKKEYFKKFYQKFDKYKNDKNIENFLELAYYCFIISEDKKLKQ